MGACLPCAREPMAWYTSHLFNHTRPGGILERAEQEAAYQNFLAAFMDPGQSLDLVYASLHTYWLHQSNIGLRSLRIVRLVDPGAAPGTAPEQVYYIDDVREGLWTWEPPQWLGLMRDSAAHPGSTRWFDSVPGSFGFVHRSDVGSEMHWQMTLVPVCHIEAYTGVMLPLAN